ncbi:MAG: T9SS type A sorting domain-containing protein, partial [Sphingobacteriales bacterium]
FNTTFTLPATAALGEHRMRIVATDAVQTPANPCYGGTYGVTLDFLVNVVPAPSCLPVTGLTVNADTITPDGAKISWTASPSAPANGYQYYVSTDNTPPTAATTPSATVPAGSTAAIITGLESATTYYVWVRSVCSATDNSSWSSPATFTTLCEGYDLTSSVYTEGFEGITANDQLPNCMVATALGTLARTYIAAQATYNRMPYSGTKFAAFRWNPGSTTWFYSAPLNVVAGEVYNVSVYYITDGAAGFTALNLAGGTSQTAAAMTVFGTVANPTNTTYQQLTATFTATATGIYYVGIQATGTSSTPWYLSFDDLSVSSNALGLGNAEQSKFIAYPNPVKDILNVSYGQNISDVAVFNMLGQQVKAKSLNAANGQIDMTDLPTGTYLVRVSADNQVKTIKVMKQ